MSRPIYATDGTNTLIQDNEAVVIGKIHSMAKSLKPRERSMRSICVELNYNEKGICDKFFFENGILVYNCVSLGEKPKGIDKVYSECFSGNKNLVLSVFLNAVVSTYTAYAMGLAQ